MSGNLPTTETPLRRSTRKRTILYALPSISKRKRVNPPTIRHLPNEILLKIFKDVPQLDVTSNLQRVCKQWYALSKDTSLWEKIDVDKDIDHKTLCEWISTASLLKHFIARNRNDMNVILDMISRKCKHLQTVELINCWGSTKAPLILSNVLCRLITRCNKLCRIRFDQCLLKSCKFFRLLPRTRRNRSIKKFSYVGPFTFKQLNTLLQSIKEDQLESNSILRSKTRTYRLNEIFKLLNHYSQTGQHNLIEQIWDDISNENELIAVDAGNNNH